MCTSKKTKGGASRPGGWVRGVGSTNASVAPRVRRFAAKPLTAHYFPLRATPSSSPSPTTFGSNAVPSSSWVRMERYLVPLQVTPWTLGQVPGSWDTVHRFREVFCVPQLTVTYDGVSSFSVCFIFHLIVQVLETMILSRGRATVTTRSSER